jgi:tetratricopeptide (TPR) repeat protein
MPRFRSLSRSDTATSALRIFVAGAKLASGTGWTDIAASVADLIGGAKNIDKAIGEMDLHPLARDLDQLRADAARAMRSGHGNSPHKIDDAEALFDQTALSAFPSSARLMQLGLDPARVLEEMLSAARQNRDFRDTPMAEAFFKLVLSKALEKLLSNKTYLEKLGPDFQRQTLANDAKTHDDLAATRAQIDQLQAFLVERLTPKAEAEGVPVTALVAIAKRIAPAVEDKDAALRELERAVEIAANVIAAGLRGSNIDALLNEVLKRLATLTAEGNLTDARAEARKALDDAREGADKARARHVRLLDAMIEQDSLARDVTTVCERVVEKVELEHPDPTERFGALRSVLIEWYERGRDKGLTYDLEVSIELARRCHALAANVDQRGNSLSDLGRALTVLGDRETGTNRLLEAIAAHGAALLERDRHRVPLEWAESQHNRGTALRMLGQRDTSTGRLEEAVEAFRASLEERTRDAAPFEWAMTQNGLGNAAMTIGERLSEAIWFQQAITAYRLALSEWTREHVSIQWAGTQNNLGNALQTLGRLESRVDWLEKAVVSYRAALTVRTREYLPLDWAMTQNNLGNTLSILGLLEPGTQKLDEAVVAYHEALLEWTINRVPLQWATTQSGLGAVELAFFDKTADGDHLDRAERFSRAAREVFTNANASHFLAQVDHNLALIAARRPAAQP